MTPEQIATAIGESEVEIKFATPPAGIYMLIGLMQVALRHPQVPELTAREAREMIDQFADMMAESLGLPEIRDLVEIGYSRDAEMTEAEFDQLYQQDVGEILQHFKTLSPSPDNN